MFPTVSVLIRLRSLFRLNIKSENKLLPSPSSSLLPSELHSVLLSFILSFFFLSFRETMKKKRKEEKKKRDFPSSQRGLAHRKLVSLNATKGRRHSWRIAAIEQAKNASVGGQD